MTSYVPYGGEAYRDIHWLEAFCESLAKAYPTWASKSIIGESRGGLPIILMTLHLGDGDPKEASAFWLDGGTHASEWAGVMATAYTMSRWAARLEAGDPELEAFFLAHTVYVVPCISPDGFQHMMEGKPFVRSTLRPPPPGQPRIGHQPEDINGDGEVLWMRWPHPAGPWVIDEQSPLAMRPRRLKDKPEDAFFCCPEGLFLAYDGVSWKQAPALHSLDLNRNFPVAWEPFRQFGMDGGDFPLSEPESRAVMDAVVARPNICIAQTNHTYTGGILVAPYRKDTPLGIWDQETLYRLADESVEGTGYRVFKVCPDFQYIEGSSIPGVWADFLVTNLGIPAYTLELWDPYAHCGVKIDNPARNFFRPDTDAIAKCLRAFADEPGCYMPWREVDHPQLGKVEVGGLRSSTTFRNPPERLLPAECERAFKVADSLRRALPRPHLEHRLEVDGDIKRLTITVENRGYLSTSALQRGAQGGLTPPPRLSVTGEDSIEILRETQVDALPHLPGWGDAPSTFRRHPLFPVLGSESPRIRRTLYLRGTGKVTISYEHPRSGTLSRSLTVS